MEWQPIETAPKDGLKILAWDGICIECIKFIGGLWVTTWENDKEYSELGMPTHWMPLPAPPSESRK